MDKNKGFPRKSKKMYAAILVVVIAVAGGAYYWQQQQAPVERDQPLLATVAIGSIENTISAAGSLKPSNFVDVGAQVSGLLQKLHVEVGDEVEEGQLLAEIDARVQEARVEASRASLEGQRAQLASRESALNLAKANFERQQKLREANATSEQEYDSAFDRLNSAEASLIQLEKQIEQSEASLLSDETELEFTRIFAPVSGTVTNIAMNEGRTLNANQSAPTILTISDLNTMTVETEISEADVSKVRKGMEVYFTTLGNGDRRWYSNLRQILPTPTVTNNVVLYTGLFDVDNSDGTLLPDMTTQVYFVSSSADDVLTVPMGALSFIETGIEDGSAPEAAANGGAAMARGGEITPEMRERIRQMRESGNMPAGAFNGGSGRQGLGRARMPRPGERSLAHVSVMRDDGTREQREVVIGLTSRVRAEVISGLKAGEQVVAGVVEADAPAREGDGGFRRPPFMRF